MSRRRQWEVSRHAAERMLGRVVGVKKPTDEEIVEAQAILWGFLHKARAVIEHRFRKARHGMATLYELPECDDHPYMRLRVVNQGTHRIVVTLIR